MKYIIRRKKIETGLMAAFAAVIVALALMVTTAACTNQVTDEMPEDGIIRVTAEASLSKNNAQTRTVHTDDTNEPSKGMTVWWTTNDAFTVFQGNTTSQKFTLNKKDADGTGHFTGSLTSGSGSGEETLYALYPASVGATTATSITLNIAAQTQASNKATTHLAEKDFMRSTATWNGTASSVAFGEFAHLMAVLRLDITLPETGTNIKNIVLTGLDSKRMLNLTKDPATESDKLWSNPTTSEITLTTTNGTTTDTKQYTAYLMVFPTTGMKELKVKVTLDNDANYTKPYTSPTGISLESGKRYWIVVKDLDNVGGGGIDGGDMGGGGNSGGIGGFD